MSEYACGDLDPGVGYYLAHTEGMSAEAGRFQQMMNQEVWPAGSVRDQSGHAGSAGQGRHGAACRGGGGAVHCYQAKKRIGSFAAVLGE